MIVVQFVVLVVTLPLVHSQITTSCYTKNDEVGVCVWIRDCKPIWEIIRDAPRPLPDNIAEYITKSHCGSPEDRTICCIQGDVVTSTETPKLYQPPRYPSRDTSTRRTTTKTTTTTTRRTTTDRGFSYERETTTRRTKFETPSIFDFSDHRRPEIRPYESEERITTTTTRKPNIYTRPSQGRPSYDDERKPVSSNGIESNSGSKREVTVNSVTEHLNVRLLDTKNCGHLSMDRIANGNHTELLQYPWMASLGYRNTRRDLSFRCGGTLISRRYVLTAGHCATNLPPRTGRLELVRLGEFDFDSEIDCERLYDEYICVEQPQDIRVQSTLVHPEYNSPKHAHDIALIRLRDDADLTHKRIKPVCLPVTEKLLGTVPQQFIVTGWGATETGVEASKLMQASMTLYPKDLCLNVLETFTRGLFFNNGQFCAEAADAVAVCSGDSGGPLLAAEGFFNYGARYVQFGIVSFGPNLCGNKKSYPAVFTDVRYYMKWILDSMQN